MFSLLLFSFCCQTVQAQKQERNLALYNVGFGVFTAGIGAVINKPEGTDWKKAFVNGCWQGGIGGGLNFASKKIVYQVNRQQDFFYALPSLIVHSAAVSIVENAASGGPFLRNWHVDYGLFRFDFSLNGQEKFRARLLPTAIYSLIEIGKRGRFDLNTSLLSGQLVTRQ
jgi:hypothetical protein